MQSLEPAARRTLAEICADQLRRRILDSSFAPGLRLPPEHQLATDLGVARLTVRSALTRLAGEGLLEVKHGSGYTVRDYREAGSALLPDVVALAVEQGHELSIIEDLLRVRRHLATALVERLVACPPAPSALQPIHEAIDHLEAVSAGGDDYDRAEADSAVLAAVLDASGSAVLQLSLHPIRAVLRALPHLRTAMYRDPAENVRGWRAFVAWVAQPVGSPDAVLALLAARDAETLRRLSAALEEAR